MNDSTWSVTEELAALRNRAGLNKTEMAHALGYKGISSYQRYENAELFNDTYLPFKMYQRLRRALIGRGKPPVSEDEVKRLVGFQEVVGTLRNKTDRKRESEEQYTNKRNQQTLQETLQTVDAREWSGQRPVPIISDVEAGEWADVVDPYEPGSGDGYLFTNRASELSFALRVIGRSMQPLFERGDYIVVDPNVPPMPGDIVVAKLDAENAATLKKYRPRGNDENGDPVIELVPLNEDWPTLTIDSAHRGRIIGTVVEHRKYRRFPQPKI